MKLADLTRIADDIGADIEALGGLLRCYDCSREIPLEPGDCGRYLRAGWPKCHGRTMEWVTERQLAKEVR